ncbi:MAG: hypothetical protein L0Z62_21700 [Gemmataceae bacterium]|nr:hypothetical protein [Gemmataceae bacterium]
MAITPEPGRSEGRNEGKNKDTIVVDLGRKGRRQIKRLRQGKGKLMDKVNECLNELKASGTISGPVQPVVIVVKEKVSPTNFMRMLG